MEGVSYVGRPKLGCWAPNRAVRREHQVLCFDIFVTWVSPLRGPHACLSDRMCKQSGVQLGASLRFRSARPQPVLGLGVVGCATRSVPDFIDLGLGARSFSEVPGRPGSSVIQGWADQGSAGFAAGGPRWPASPERGRRGEGVRFFSPAALHLRGAGVQTSTSLSRCWGSGWWAARQPVVTLCTWEAWVVTLCTQADRLARMQRLEVLRPHILGSNALHVEGLGSNALHTRAVSVAGSGIPAGEWELGVSLRSPGALDLQ